MNHGGGAPAEPCGAVVRSFVPLVKDARLNEQHSGSLTGKIQCDSNLRP